MGGHCSQTLCPGGEGTPLRGAADLRINTRSTTLSQRSATRGLVSQAFSFSPPTAARIWLPPAGHPRLLETSSVGLGLQSPPLTIGGAVPAGPSKWLPPPPPLTRDRDRLRQEILENLGWTIHRIWSTDWFKNRDGEIRRLLQRIQDLLAHDPSYLEMQQKAKNIQTLRQHLVMLRETEINPAFPNTPVGQGLLQDGLLEEFVQKRPKTRDDWFREISQDLRTGVDSRQVARYLDRVLEIIGACEG